MSSSTLNQSFLIDKRLISITTMGLVKGIRRLNEHQIKAIANLLLEIGKWLLLSVVFSSLFIEVNTLIEIKRIVGALLYALAIIIIAIWMLKGVKKDG